MLPIFVVLFHFHLLKNQTIGRNYGLCDLNSICSLLFFFFIFYFFIIHDILSFNLIQMRVRVAAVGYIFDTCTGILSSLVFLTGSLLLMFSLFRFLQGNYLSGPIPSELGNLTVLQNL